jgi:hypothetical protein
MDLSRIYPCLAGGDGGEAVPPNVAATLDQVSRQASGGVVVGVEGTYTRPPADWMPELGHGVHVMLYHDEQDVLSHGGRGVLYCVLPDALDAEKVSPTQAHAIALQNLERLARAQTFKAGVHSTGPQGRPFARWGGHRLAASCILLPGVYKWASKLLGTDEVCASIPHDDSLVLFAKADRSYREAMRAMIRQAEEADTSPPLTFELFALSAGGVSAFREHE